MSARDRPWDQREGKIRPEHRDRSAVVCVRQSSRQQVSEHTESTRLQYALVERTVGLGWARSRVMVIDDDLGHSAAVAGSRPGFEKLVTEADDGAGRDRAGYRDVPAGSDRSGLAPVAGAVLVVRGAAG